jgi:hypothetical protein
MEQHKTQTNPAGGEVTQIEGLAVEQMKEAVVCLTAEAQDADVAGNPGSLRTATEAH